MQYVLPFLSIFDLVHGQQHKGPEKNSDTALHGGRHDIPAAPFSAGQLGQNPQEKMDKPYKPANRNIIIYWFQCALVCLWSWCYWFSQLFMYTFLMDGL